MQKRFVSIWFRHLLADRLVLRQPELKDTPFVIVNKERGRLIVIATNQITEAEGVYPGMVAADAKAIVPGLEVIDEIPGQREKLLKAIGLWCIRYSPIIAVDLPDGLVLDVSGCAHLWGGERGYLKEIVTRLRSKGYDVRAAMADTVGAAWAIARFGKITPIIGTGKHIDALLNLPPAALRLDPITLELIKKLGFRTIGSLTKIKRSALRRRFGTELLQRINQAFGSDDEPLQSLQPVEPYQERLPCLEPIKTVTGIEIAIQKLLELICKRLQQDGKGLRTAILKGYRIDGKITQIAIGTSRASHHIPHLYKLFELNIAKIAPGMGIELFTLEAPKVEDVSPEQEILWAAEGTDLESRELAELLDRLAGKLGNNIVKRYLPQEHYWPERSIRPALSLSEKPPTAWRTDKPRPTRLLTKPEHIEVTAPVPDYPPILFRYQDEIHYIKKADGPERIEREWWLESGAHRDYYYVEDEKGQRYWLFRSGHYDAENSQWFIHGFFA